MPGYKIGVGPMPTNNNVEALEQQYYSGCLQIFLEAMELCLDEGLGMGPGMGTEFDLDGLLRMDSAAMYEALGKGVGAAILKPNEARKKLNLPPVAGGDTPPTCSSRTIRWRRCKSATRPTTHSARRDRRPRRPLQRRLQPQLLAALSEQNRRLGPSAAREEHLQALAARLALDPEAGQIDVTVRVGPLADSALVLKPLGTVRSADHVEISGRTVGIVGAGPAALAAAEQLREQPAENHRIGDILHLKFIEAQQLRFLRDRFGEARQEIGFFPGFFIFLTQ